MSPPPHGPSSRDRGGPHGPSAGKRVRFRVIPSEEGMILRVWVARRVPGLSQAAARDLIRAGGVYVNALRVRVPTVRVAPGERITVYPEALDATPLDPSLLEIRHRDAQLLVVDKPAGVAVTATKESAVGTLSDALIRMLEAEGVRRPYVGVVHRLDRRASGLVLFTVRGEANKSIHQAFKDHRIERTYLLELRGHLTASQTCEVPLRIRRGSSVRVADPGDPRAVTARTHFEPLAQLEDTTVVRAQLDTGRMHQIRVHAAHLGHPVVGDARYGDPDAAAQATAAGGLTSPLHLHAQRLALTHPITGAPLEIDTSPPPWAPAFEGTPRKPPA